MALRGARRPGHKDPFVRLPHTPPPHLGERAARDAKMFRGTKPARRSWDGGPGPSYFLSSLPLPEEPKGAAWTAFPHKVGWRSEGGGGGNIVCSRKSRKEFLFWTYGRRIRRPNLSNSREGSSNPTFFRFFVVFDADKILKGNKPEPVPCDKIRWAWLLKSAPRPELCVPSLTCQLDPRKGYRSPTNSLLCTPCPQ